MNHPNSLSSYDEQVMYSHPRCAEGNKVSLRIFRRDKSTTKLCINTHSYLRIPKDCRLTLASGVCEVQRIIQKVVLYNNCVQHKKLFRGMWVFFRTKRNEGCYKLIQNIVMILWKNFVEKIRWKKIGFVLYFCLIVCRRMFCIYY